MNILYVCLGNICRSPMAEFMLRDAVAGRQSLSGQPIVVHGAGVAAEVGSPATREVRAVLADAGIPMGVMRGVALLARCAGLLGHLVEEQTDPIGIDVYMNVDRNIDYQPPK